MKSESRNAANLIKYVFHCVVRVSKVQNKAIYFQYFIVISSHILILDEFSKWSFDAECSQIILTSNTIHC